MITVWILISVLFILLGTVAAISGYVAYQEGVEDERRGWYIHAHRWLHKESEFEKENGINEWKTGNPKGSLILAHTTKEFNGLNEGYEVLIKSRLGYYYGYDGDEVPRDAIIEWITIKG